MATKKVTKTKPVKNLKITAQTLGTLSKTDIRKVVGGMCDMTENNGSGCKTQQGG